MVVILSENLMGSLQYWVAMFFEILMPSFLIWVSFYRSKEIIKAMEIFLVIFAILTIYGTIADLISVNPVVDLIEKHVSSSERKMIYTYESLRFGVYGRAQSVFYHPLQYGCFIFVALCILFYLQKARVKINKYLLIFLIILFFGAIITTRSRSPLLAIMIAGFVYLFLIELEIKIRVLSLMVLIGGISSFFISAENDKVAMLISILQEITGKGSFVQGSSLEMRIFQMRNVFEIFKQNPLSGHGLTCTRDMINMPGLGILGAESIVFVLMIDTGMIGIAAYAFFLFALFWHFWKVKKNADNSNIKRLSIIMICMIFGYSGFICATGEMKTFPLFIMTVTLSAKHLSLCKDESKT